MHINAGLRYFAVVTNGESYYMFAYYLPEPGIDRHLVVIPRTLQGVAFLYTPFFGFYKCPPGDRLPARIKRTLGKCQIREKPALSHEPTTGKPTISEETPVSPAWGLEKATCFGQNPVRVGSPPPDEAFFFSLIHPLDILWGRKARFILNDRKNDENTNEMKSKPDFPNQNAIFASDSFHVFRFRLSVRGRLFAAPFFIVDYTVPPLFWFSIHFLPALLLSQRRKQMPKTSITENKAIIASMTAYY